MKIIVLCCLFAVALVAQAEEAPEDDKGTSEEFFRYCRIGNCNAVCRLKNQLGKCVKKRCKCIGNLTFEVDESFEPEPAPRICHVLVCSKQCAAMRFSGGRCIPGMYGRCYCIP